MAKRRTKKDAAIEEAEQNPVVEVETSEEAKEAAAKLAKEEAEQAEAQAAKETEEAAAKLAKEEAEQAEAQAAKEAKEAAAKQGQTKKKKTFEDLYEEKKDDVIVGPVAEALKYYIDICYKQKHSDGETIASMNYNLFNTIIGALSVEDKQASKAKMDFINRAFLVEKDGYFNTVSLTRFDHFWAYGNESKMGYTMLVKYISGMANPNTRKQKSKVLIAEKMAKFLPEGIIGKLETYYKV